MKRFSTGVIAGTVFLLSSIGVSAGDIHYQQNFEAPNGWVNDCHGANRKKSVNALFPDLRGNGGFKQIGTVETVKYSELNKGAGIVDPTGQGGQYAIAMMSNPEDDKLALAFNIASRKFLNVEVDITSISVAGCSDRWHATSAPTLVLTLYDNPGGRRKLQTNRILSRVQLDGTATTLDTLDWTTFREGLDASASETGEVLLQFDLVSGGYAAFDNLKISSSDRSISVEHVKVAPSGTPILRKER